jgi:hypothetical protein
VTCPRPRNTNLRPTKKDKLCRYFTKTGSPTARRTPKLTLGSCSKGLSCRYSHDPTKLALCPQHLKDQCPLSAEQCPLSHSPSAHRSPTCVHFSRGHCEKPHCKYAHIKLSALAEICPPFAYTGYCPRGAECAQRHVFECPEFEALGECSRPACKLAHVDTAQTVRRREQRGEDDVSRGEEVSSGEEEEDDDVESLSEGDGFEDQLDFMRL